MSYSNNKVFKAGDMVYVTHYDYETDEPFDFFYTVYGYTEDEIKLIVINDAGKHQFLDPQIVYSNPKWREEGDTVQFPFLEGELTVYGYTRDKVEIILIDETGKYHILDPLFIAGQEVVEKPRYFMGMGGRPIK